MPRCSPASNFKVFIQSTKFRILTKSAVSTHIAVHLYIQYQTKSSIMRDYFSGVRTYAHIMQVCIGFGVSGFGPINLHSHFRSRSPIFGFRIFKFYSTPNLLQAALYLYPAVQYFSIKQGSLEAFSISCCLSLQLARSLHIQFESFSCQAFRRHCHSDILSVVTESTNGNVRLTQDSNDVLNQTQSVEIGPEMSSYLFEIPISINSNLPLYH